MCCFTCHRIINWQMILFFKCFNDAPLSFGLGQFWQDVHGYSYVRFPVGNVLFFSVFAFKILSTSLVFGNFIIMTLAMIFFMFTLLVVFWACWSYGFTIFIKFVWFSAILCQLHFLFLPFSLCLLVLQSHVF